MAIVLAGTAGGLYRIGTGADPRPAQAGLAGRDVRALAGDGGRLWALADEALARRTPDGSWVEVTARAPWPATCLLDAPAGLLAGTAEAHLLLLEEGELTPVASFDEVEGREKWYTPWGGPADTRSMSLAPDGTVYVNVHVGGIVRSASGVDGWVPTIDIDADVHQVLAHPERAGVVLAAAARGLALSDDGGASWRLAADGLHAAYCRAVAVGAGGLVLVSASEGPSGRRSAVYRADLDGDLRFERCIEGVPGWFGSNVDTHCLGALGSRVVFGTGNGEVFSSDDGGQTWDRAAEGLPPVRCVAITGLLGRLRGEIREGRKQPWSVRVARGG